MIVARPLAAVALIAIAGSAACQPAYPTKPIHFITPFAPGGSTGVVARLISEKLNERWGQPVIVENRPGGNTIIGTEAVAKARPDGYTMLMVTSVFAIAPSLLASLPYDTIKDFAPVATISISPHLLAVHPSLPAGTLKQLIALAKSKPGQLNYASSATGGVTHLAGELLNIMAGTRIQHVPYKGGGPALVDLIGGQVQMSINVPSNFVQHVKAGKLKAIAVTGETRLLALPQVPTFAEAGLPGFDTNNWFGVVVPARTPEPIVDKLSTEIARILALPAIKETLLTQMMDPIVSTPEQFAQRIKADMARYGKIIKTANIKAD